MMEEEPHPCKGHAILADERCWHGQGGPLHGGRADLAQSSRLLAMIRCEGLEESEPIERRLLLNVNGPQPRNRAVHDKNVIAVPFVPLATGVASSFRLGPWRPVYGMKRDERAD